MSCINIIEKIFVSIRFWCSPLLIALHFFISIQNYILRALFGQHCHRLLQQYIGNYSNILRIARLLSHIWDELIDRIFRSTPVVYSAKSEDMVDKCVVITDGDSRYGKRIATVMIENGAKVIVGYKKGKTTLWMNKLKRQYPNSYLQAIPLNMAYKKSILDFKDEVLFERIDILILNACLLLRNDTRLVVHNSIEIHFGANHLGHLLLTYLLLDALKASTSARIVIESSASHIFGTIHFADINLLNNYSTMKAYFQSKLANVLFAHRLARTAKASETRFVNFSPEPVVSYPLGSIKTYCVNPGCRTSELEWRHRITGLPFIERLLYTVFNLVRNRSQYSINTTLFCALDASVTDESGCYYSNCRRVNIDICDDMANGLWDLSCDMLAIQKNFLLIQPNVNCRNNNFRF